MRERGTLMYLEDLGVAVHKTAKEKGHWEGEYNYDKYGTKLALLHSEVTEILEALRKKKGPDAVADEFADVIVRAVDLYYVLRQKGFIDKDLTTAIEEKTKVNENRSQLHGHQF